MTTKGLEFVSLATVAREQHMSGCCAHRQTSRTKTISRNQVHTWLKNCTEKGEDHKAIQCKIYYFWVCATCHEDYDNII